MVLCSSREKVPLKFKKKLARPPDYYSGSNSLVSPLSSNGPDNTFKSDVHVGLCYVCRSTRLVVRVHKLANYFTLICLSYCIGWAMAGLESVMFPD